MPKQFCLRGHDTHETGRNKNYACIVCDRERKVRVRAVARESRPPCVHGPACGCEMCVDRRVRTFVDTWLGQWEEAQWEASA